MFEDIFADKYHMEMQFFGITKLLKNGSLIVFSIRLQLILQLA